jgi:hypothetical protein
MGNESSSRLDRSSFECSGMALRVFLDSDDDLPPGPILRIRFRP